MNHLAGETSPYLLQHAANPVDWHPWGEEALTRAVREDKPILLSIGYSACHWCHVMAHESFEDPATARVMNELYINIKVDREERPDLDRIYQVAHHLLVQGSGGWPLTLFLTPGELAPFFSGTYFPGTARYGIPSFIEVLTKAAAYYRQHSASLAGQAPALREAMRELEAATPAARERLEPGPLQRFREFAGQQFDQDFGGFGAAPKFPQSSTLELLLRCWWRSAREPAPDLDALFMCALTLQRMADGGIHDQVGGGFCRYAVDRHWSIPHFEKMLYDNAALLALYSQLFQISGDDGFRRTALATAEWALREMRAPQGAFYSSIDADAGGEEGGFYVWTPQEIRSLVTDEEYAVLAPHFGLDQEPNFEDRWHLRIYRPLAELASSNGQPESTLRRLLGSACTKLYRARATRVAPARDEKILTSWNARMVRALAIASRVLDHEDLGDAAGQALEFMRHELVVDGRLHATWKDGRARFNAYLDDHAFLLEATLELLQTRWQGEHLRFALWLAEQLLSRFHDPALGGFFFTAHDHEALLHRSRSLADDALPSGAATAALALNRLGHLLGEPRYIEAAEDTVRHAWEHLAAHPAAHATMLMALDEILAPPQIVILRGPPCQLADWLGVARAAFAPNRLVFAIETGATDLPGALATRTAAADPLAYICQGSTCLAPVHSLEALGKALAGDHASGD